MLPLVTISIPLYQCEDFLIKCLQSVERQTYENIEVTLINDQTPDKSVEMAEDFIEKHQLNTWKIIHLEKNSGLSVVRNKGIETAQGKYLFFLDSDDVITPECIAVLVSNAEETGAEMTVSQIECVKLESGEKSFCLGELRGSLILSDNLAVFRAFVAGDIPSSAVNKLMVTEVIKERELYFVPGLFAQDELWTFQTCLSLERVSIYSGEPTYTYYLHGKSVIHNRGKRNFDNWFTIGQYIDAAYKKENKKDRKILILEYLTNFKTMTLQMNWKAQKNEGLWKESYKNYKTLSGLSLKNYFSGDFSIPVKKSSFYTLLPVDLGFKLFKWRYNR